jgi:UDP-N-acetylmuramate dehydrogenase
MSAFDAYCALQGTLDGEVYCDEPMYRHTSYRIGGPAALYIECATVADINRSFEMLKEYNMPWVVVGKGSNLLVADEGFAGAVLTLGAEFKRFSFAEEGDDHGLLVAGGGVILSSLVQNAFKGGYAGLEFGVGIPGTLGGALFMNAGSADEWIGSIVETVTLIRLGEGLLRLRSTEIPWAYRSSGLPAGDVIVESTMRLTPGNAMHIRARMEALLKRRKRTQPLNMPSAGSVFRNPGDNAATAGELIDLVGLKGYKVGGAQVSEQHANFIVNTGTATAADVLAIISEIRRRVNDSYGTQLQPEIRFVGFKS